MTLSAAASFTIFAKTQHPRQPQ